MKPIIIAFFAPIIALLIFFGVCHQTQRTLLPLDIYLISEQLYQVGNAKLVHNSYMTDTLDVFLPWKYYIYKFNPPLCNTQVGSEKWGFSKSWGLTLPQGFCYPIGTVRPSLYVDSLWIFSKVFSFFDAYNLSYVFLLTCLYLAALYFFYTHTRGNLFASAVGAILAVTSFPVARELQHDGLVLAIPFVFLGLALFNKSLDSRKKRYGSLFLLCLGLAIWRSTLQSMAVVPGLACLYIMLWVPQLNLKAKFKIIALVGLVVFAAVIWNLPAIRVFLSQVQEFVPEKSVPYFIAAPKRALAWLLSILHSILGPLIFSFDTVDFYKSLGNLGAREYPSYDGSSVYLGPVVGLAILFVATGVLKTKRAILKLPIFKSLVLSLLVDLLICMSPLYKLLYFRFHQWWILLSILLFLTSLIATEDVWEFDIQKIKKFSIFSIVAVTTAVLFILAAKNFLLLKLNGQGVLGFENGFWDFRIEKWIERITFREWYGIAWLLFGMSGVYLFLKSKHTALVWLLSLSGLIMVTFHFNFPQRISIFNDYLVALEAKGWNLKSSGRALHENNLLLVNKPVYSVYESLTVPMPPAKEKNDH